MGDVLSLPVLVLNRFFEPVQVTSARRAFVLLYGGNAMAVEDGDLHDFGSWRELPVREPGEAVSTASGDLRVPRVLHLSRYERTPRTLVRLTRKNVMLRDAYQCQYCGARLPARDLNLDHVMPRSRGGRDTWENLVTACTTCNLRKGSRTPEEAGFRLLRPPVRPRWTPAARILLHAGQSFPEWHPFLQAG